MGVCHIAGCRLCYCLVGLQTGWVKSNKQTLPLATRSYCLHSWRMPSLSHCVSLIIQIIYLRCVGGSNIVTLDTLITVSGSHEGESSPWFQNTWGHIIFHLPADSLEIIINNFISVSSLSQSCWLQEDNNGHPISFQLWELSIMKTFPVVLMNYSLHYSLTEMFTMTRPLKQCWIEGFVQVISLCSQWRCMRISEPLFCDAVNLDCIGLLVNYVLCLCSIQMQHNGI